MNDLILKEVAHRYGTPTYVYSVDALEKNIERFTDPMRSKHALLAVAMKANSNIHLLQKIARHNMGVDVVSQGELLCALKAGIPAKKIVFSGVGKTQDELDFAIGQGILFINVESEDEIEAIAKLSQVSRKRTSVSLRFNPDVTIDSNPKIATGGKQHKFGLGKKLVLELCKKYKNNPWVHIECIHAHLGSQIFEKEYFLKLKERLSLVIPQIQEALGYSLTAVNFGGGYGVDQNGNVPKWVPEWISEAIDFANKLGCLAIFEPGRSIFANAGLLLTKIIRIKKSENTHFAVVDAGMNDFMRTALYGAIHHFKVIGAEQGGESTEKFDVVGPICETTDTFIQHLLLPTAIKSGDLLAMEMAGAYGFSMSSQYNMRCRPAEVLVERNGDIVLSRKRETFDDLFQSFC